MLDFSNEQIFTKFCIHRADKGKKRQNLGKDQDRILDAKRVWPDHVLDTEKKSQIFKGSIFQVFSITMTFLLNLLQRE